MTSLLAYGVRLAFVLGHASMNLLNDIWSDRARKDGGHGVRRPGGLAIFADDRDGRSRSHCKGLEKLNLVIKLSESDKGLNTSERYGEEAYQYLARRQLEQWRCRAWGGG